jgi:hypothetical protein
MLKDMCKPGEVAGGGNIAGEEREPRCSGAAKTGKEDEEAMASYRGGMGC